MPSWDEVQREVRSSSTYDIVRRSYLRRLSELTGRNVIVYYSGWLEKAHLVAQGLTGTEVNDSDKNGFMATIHQLDRTKGLDLVLHTPGGNVAATESLVDYLRSMFGSDIRAIVPQLAMSAGTMIALASKQIVMGQHSSLGPIDPQTGGVAAHGVVEEFDRAREEIRNDPSTIPLWQPIIAKYSPTLVGECEKAIKWANSMVKAWLETGMFSSFSDKGERADKVLSELADHALTLSHARHISADGATQLGLELLRLESDQDLQEAVLSVHHACIQTLADTPAFKIIENHLGVSFITAVSVSAVS
jgi:ATP-dependent protease ClpP protease subunit